MEVVAPLASVDSILGIDRSAPEATLNVRCGRRVRAARVARTRVDGWISLEIDIDRNAVGDGVALGSTGVDIVSLQSRVPKVAITSDRSADAEMRGEWRSVDIRVIRRLKVGELLHIATRSRGRDGCR